MLLKLWENINKVIRFHSLRARIFLILLIVGIVPSVFMRYGVLQSYEDRAIQNRISTVQNQLIIIANHLLGENYLLNYQSKSIEDLSARRVINAELEMLSNLYDGRVQIINSNFKIIKDTYGISEGKTIISEEIIKCFQGKADYQSYYNREHGYIELIIPIIDNTLSGTGDEASKDLESTIKGVMLTSVSDDSIRANREILSRKAIILETIIVFVILVVAFVVSGMVMKPFARVTEAIHEVKAGYSEETITVPDYVETVHIIEAFNQLLQKMKAVDDSRQEFVANVSHELKTPLASMKVLSDSLLGQENVPIELYQEFLQDITSEIDRETRIITDLLSLVKMDKKAQRLNIVSININDLAELILKRLRPIARKKDVEVVFESMRPVVAEVDEVKITLIMSNLVENAIKYNREHGWVKVTLNADHQNFTFEVSDSGMGIPEESMAHIYERFYRVDKSHSREIGGTGLGLAITRSAVLMHRGSITVTSTEGEGTNFLVKIPLNHIVQ